LQTMNSESDHPLVLLLVCNKETREYLSDLLRRNSYSPQAFSVPADLLNHLRAGTDVIVFVDGQAVSNCGAGIFSKIRESCSGCKVIFLCDRAHRELIKEAMGLGAYGCVLEPYEEWEVLTMVRHVLSDLKPKRRRSSKKTRRPAEG